MTLPSHSISLYAEGAQNRAHFDRGIPRYVVEHLRAMQKTRPEMLHSVLLSPVLPLTGNLSWLLGSGLLRLEYRRSPDRRSALQCPKRLPHHVPLRARNTA